MGVSFSEFMDLIDKHEIEVSYRGGNKLLVNDDTLDSYILKYGGRQERYDEFIITKTELTQDREILKFGDLILSSSSKIVARNKLRDGDFSSSTFEISVNKHNGKEIMKLYKLVNQIKENRATLDKLYSVGFTDNTLNKYFRDSSFDYEKYHAKKDYIVKFQEIVSNVTFTFKAWSDFFNSYKVFEKRYSEIDFLTKSQKYAIVEKANKKFGY